MQEPGTVPWSVVEYRERGKSMEDGALLDAEDVMAYLRCGRTFVYGRLRHLALDVSPDSGRPMLRWRRSMLDALARPARLRARVRLAGAA